MVAKKWLSLSAWGAFVHALATEAKAGSNSLRQGVDIVGQMYSKCLNLFIYALAGSTSTLLVQSRELYGGSPVASWGGEEVEYFGVESDDAVVGGSELDKGIVR